MLTHQTEQRARTNQRKAAFLFQGSRGVQGLTGEPGAQGRQVRESAVATEIGSIG